jgi:glycosyltransferase involved in cell wall biosynthesis
MIAPEPFFEPRGTPFSEFFRISALCELGHRVDLVTYPLGKDVHIKGLTIYRSAGIPGIRTVKTGPSFLKVILDIFLFFKSWTRLKKERYHLIHTHEEANIMGVFFSRRFRIPHLYDMHSSLVQQMDNFKFTRWKPVVGFFRFIERKSLENASSVIVICRSLFDHAAKITEAGKLTLIENFRDDNDFSNLDPRRLKDLRRQLAAPGDRIILYTGTLEKYQGIPLLLEAMVQLPAECKLVLVGGKPYQIAEVEKAADRLGVRDRVVCTGRQDPDRMPYYLKTAQVLVSPRILGTNIPLKIYSYLKSGIPVVATDLYTHTQSLNDLIAVLVPPTAEGLAEGIRAALGTRGRAVSRAAAEFCRSRYSADCYRQLVARAVEVAVAGKSNQEAET